MLSGAKMLLALPFKISIAVHASCIVGGMATPTAWKILPQTPLLWFLIQKPNSKEQLERWWAVPQALK
jgi:hypothetical protein